jgi:hypothetical protein
MLPVSGDSTSVPMDIESKDGKERKEGKEGKDGEHFFSGPRVTSELYNRLWHSAPFYEKDLEAGGDIAKNAEEAITVAMNDRIIRRSIEAVVFTSLGKRHSDGRAELPSFSYAPFKQIDWESFEGGDAH